MEKISFYLLNMATKRNRYRTKVNKKKKKIHINTGRLFVFFFIISM
jgi:transglutaminase/protease-like cytokinesis protein 3